MATSPGFRIFEVKNLSSRSYRKTLAEPLIKSQDSWKILLACLFFLQEKRKYSYEYYFSNQTSMNLICDEKEIFYQDNSHKDFLQYYQKRFSDRFINQLYDNS